LYAYFYDPGKAEKKINSWGLYQPAKEFARMGVGTTTHEWRITHINKDYSVCIAESWILIVVVCVISCCPGCAIEDLR
jgi:myotubularin-related protein 6/7/8